MQNPIRKVGEWIADALVEKIMEPIETINKRLVAGRIASVKDGQYIAKGCVNQGATRRTMGDGRSRLDISCSFVLTIRVRDDSCGNGIG